MIIYNMKLIFNQSNFIIFKYFKLNQINLKYYHIKMLLSDKIKEIIIEKSIYQDRNIFVFRIISSKIKNIIK